MRSEAVVREFQRLLEPGTVAGLTEPQVLKRFAERGDAVAFEAIVTRHGPMVYTVCRQMLRDPNDVDDAAQATFLILIKKAGRLRRPERLGPWLYGVAYRVAHRLRMRPTSSDLPDDLAGPRLACPVEDNEEVAMLHDEIQRLPEKYRVPIVLCCIEGLSHDEAAKRLGWPVGTVHGRLSRAKERLRNRLTRRGVSMSGGVPELIALIRRGQMILPEVTRLAALALVGGTVPASLDILSKGVLSAMFTEKLRQTGIFVVMTLVGLGTATTALQAYQGREAEKTERTPHTTTSGIQRNPGEKKDDKPRADPAAIPKEETNDEIALEKLDEMRVDAEMRQMELEALRETTRTCVRLINQLRLERKAESAKDSQRRLEEVEKNYHNYLELYRDRLLQFAALKRKIGRASKTLGLTSEFGPTKSGQDDRLDRVEDKLDRIIEVLNAKSDQ